MSLVTTVMVGNADKEWAKLGRDAMLDDPGRGTGLGVRELEGWFAWVMSGRCARSW